MVLASPMLAETAPPQRTLADLPSPKGLPLFGNVLDAWREPIPFLTRSAELGSVVRFRFGPFDFLQLNDVEDVHHVLIERQKSYVKSRSYDGVRLVLGQGLLTTEGDHWKKQRKLAQPAFHHQRLRGFAGTFASTTGEMLARWKGRQDVSLHSEMMRLTLRMVGLTLFSSDVEGDAAEIGDALNVAIRFANAYVEQIVRIPMWVPLPSHVRFRRALATLDRLVYRLIEDRRKSGEPGNDLLGMLLAATDEATKERMSDTELRDEVMTIVLAGHETTANALVWTLCLLAQHPEARKKLRAEVVSVLGDRAPAFEDLPRLAYTERVVQESMRLYPPAWCFERLATQDDVIGGCAIPKGTTVVIAPYTLHRSARYWQDPERFDPDRFAAEGAKNNPAYLPFGDGPRVCIGRGFAMMEAKIALAMIVRDFDVATPRLSEIQPEPGITLRPKGDVPSMLAPVNR